MIIVICIMFLLAGLAEGAMDWLEFKLEARGSAKIINSKFWNPNYSWANKWKNAWTTPLKEKFFLSSTLLVFLTDGWHLMKWCRNRFINVSGITALCYFGTTWYWAILIVVVSETIYHLGFYITYKK